MVRVLCLGYSVTELPGYVERANALAEAEGRPVTFLRSGWGGHSLPSIAALIDEILDALPCDRVLLELFTGNVRYFDGATMRAYLDDILAATARRDLPVAFLNLHQGGVDYAAEPVAGLLAEYRALYGIPYLDIAAPVAAAGAGDITYLLKDATHVTPAGADLYGTLVYSFLRAPPPGRAYIDRFRTLPGRFEALPLRALPGLTCGFALRRNGIPLDFLEIPEGTGVAGDVDLVLALELFSEVVEEGVVKVFAAQVGVTCCRLDGKDAAGDGKERDIESAAAEIEDEDHLFLL